jgi:hypothetical protein
LLRAPLGCKAPHGGPLPIEFSSAVYHVAPGGMFAVAVAGVTRSCPVKSTVAEEMGAGPLIQQLLDRLLRTAGT